MFRRDFVTSLAAAVVSLFGRSSERTIVFGKGKPHEKRLRIVSAKSDELTERLKQLEAEALRKARAEVRAIRWVPVTERLPEFPISDGGNGQTIVGWARVLVWSLDCGGRAFIGHYSDGEWSLGDKGIVTDVTHWAELPAPPAEVTA